MLAEGFSLKVGFRSDRNHKQLIITDEKSTDYKQRLHKLKSKIWM